MQKSEEQIKKEFTSDLSELLKKYHAELDVTLNYNGVAVIRVYCNPEYNSDYTECIVDSANFELGHTFNVGDDKKFDEITPI